MGAVRSTDTPVVNDDDDDHDDDDDDDDDDDGDGDGDGDDDDGGGGGGGGMSQKVLGTAPSSCSRSTVCRCGAGISRRRGGKASGSSGERIRGRTSRCISYGFWNGVVNRQTGQPTLPPLAVSRLLSAGQRCNEPCDARCGAWLERLDRYFLSVTCTPCPRPEAKQEPSISPTQPNRETLQYILQDAFQWWLAGFESHPSACGKRKILKCRGC